MDKYGNTRKVTFTIDDSQYLRNELKRNNLTDKEIDEILDEYGVDEEDVIEEYLEDYYGENKRKPQKRQKSKNKRKNSASPYQKNR